MEIIIKKPYVKYPKTNPIDWSKEKSRTRQSHAKESDINNILKKYQKTGILNHVNLHEAKYDDVTGIDFQTAMNLVIDAQSMFMDLPSSVRSKFANDPAQFYDFVQNPENDAEMIEMGLKADPNAAPIPSDDIDPHAVTEAPAPAEPTP